jgi:hypothetical protein
MSSTVQLLACTEGTPFAGSPLAPQQFHFVWTLKKKIAK